MGRKETEEAIADSRAGRVAGRFATVGELLAGRFRAHSVDDLARRSTAR
jgi:hypothetical protein